MLIQADVAEAKAILGAMHRVASGNGRQALSDACASGLRSAAQYVFALGHDIRIEELPAVKPADLASILITREQKDTASRFLAVLPLVDGRLDEEKIDVFLQYADARYRP